MKNNTIKPNNKFYEFVSSISSTKSQSVYKLYSSLGDYNYTNCDVDFVEKVIIDANPKNIKNITNICGVLKKYAVFINDKNLVNVIEKIDRHKLWKTIKQRGVKKFISYQQYQNICHDIDMWEEHNSLYYKTLFMAVYEGIYSNYSQNTSVIRNLRSGDVEDGIVILRPDDEESYALKISKELSDNLIELSSINIWEQTGRCGTTQHKLSGDYLDTIFKTKKTKNATNREFEFYYRRLNKIAKNYIEYPLTAYELFISGLMHRIVVKLKATGITVQEAFKMNNRNKEVKKIFSDELTRCHYTNTFGNFRELVEGYLDVFDE